MADNETLVKRKIQTLYEVLEENKGMNNDFIWNMHSIENQMLEGKAGDQSVAEYRAQEEEVNALNK